MRPASFGVTSDQSIGRHPWTEERSAITHRYARAVSCGGGASRPMAISPPSGSPTSSTYASRGQGVFSSATFRSTKMPVTCANFHANRYGSADRAMYA